MTNASEVCDKLGRKHMAECLGVGVTTISNAAVAGVFPAKWYVVVRDLCAKAGVDCPDTLFNFTKPLSDAKPAALRACTDDAEDAPMQEAS